MRQGYDSRKGLATLTDEAQFPKDILPGHRKLILRWLSEPSTESEPPPKQPAAAVSSSAMRVGEDWSFAFEPLQWVRSLGGGRGVGRVCLYGVKLVWLCITLVRK